jgi:hypothetical protein
VILSVVLGLILLGAVVFSVLGGDVPPPEPSGPAVVRASPPPPRGEHLDEAPAPALPPPSPPPGLAAAPHPAPPPAAPAQADPFDDAFAPLDAGQPWPLNAAGLASAMGTVSEQLRACQREFPGGQPPPGTPIRGRIGKSETGAPMISGVEIIAEGGSPRARAGYAQCLGQAVQDLRFGAPAPGEPAPEWLPLPVAHRRPPPMPPKTMLHGPPR